MKKYGTYNMKKKDKFTIENVGSFIYYSYKAFKFIIFLLNIFIIYKCIIHNTQLLIISFVLNTIYLILYYRRPIIIILAILFMFYVTNNYYESFIVGLALGNTVSYIIDLIEVTFISYIMQLIDKISLKHK